MESISKVEQPSDREWVVSRLISAPPGVVFDAWANPEFFKKWWIPESFPMQLESCEMDVRLGGKYRLRIRAGSESAEFFGRYLEVVPASRLVWTNEEGGAGAAVITTVTFEDREGGTFVRVHDLYPTKESLQEAIATGATGGMPEQLAQLDKLMRERL